MYIMYSISQVGQRFFSLHVLPLSHREFHLGNRPTVQGYCSDVNLRFKDPKNQGSVVSLMGCTVAFEQIGTRGQQCAHIQSQWVAHS